MYGYFILKIVFSQPLSLSLFDVSPRPDMFYEFADDGQMFDVCVIHQPRISGDGRPVSQSDFFFIYIVFLFQADGRDEGIPKTTFHQFLARFQTVDLISTLAGDE